MSNARMSGARRERDTVGNAPAQVVGIHAGASAFRAWITARGVSRLEFAEAPAEAPLPPLAIQLATQLEEYLAGQRTRFDVPLDLSACPVFQRRILEACARVPAGATVTYAELAAQAGYPGAARAAGSALARNPVPLLIPCHRVVRADGGLGGYLAGLAWKRRLLALEGVLL